MKAVVKKKRPLLKDSHIEARFDFAKTHLDWTMEDWKKVVWSDETKINRLGSDGRKWAWKKQGEGLSERLVDGTVKFGGGSLMIWGCMLWDGPGFACKIDGKMDGELYIKIMEDELKESLAYYNKQVEDVIFQQDNDPKHTCIKAREYFAKQEYKKMKWPAQSPDLNPIEHLWNHLKRRLAEYETPPGGMLELWERVQVEWDKIGPEVCQNLIESMPRRVRAVWKAKGGVYQVLDLYQLQKYQNCSDDIPSKIELYLRHYLALFDNKNISRKIRSRAIQIYGHAVTTCHQC